jgi:hypothetical protein
LREHARLTVRAEGFIAGGFAAAAVFLAATGVFPVQSPASTVVHNAAGFATPILVMVTIAGARVALGRVSWFFDRASVVLVAAIAAMFTAAWAVRVVPYALMEVVCFAFIGAWLWIFEESLRRLGHSSGASDHVAFRGS